MCDYNMTNRDYSQSCASSSTIFPLSLQESGCFQEEVYECYAEDKFYKQNPQQNPQAQTLVYFQEDGANVDDLLNLNSNANNTNTNQNLVQYHQVANENYPNENPHYYDNQYQNTDQSRICNYNNYPNNSNCTYQYHQNPTQISTVYQSLTIQENTKYQELPYSNDIKYQQQQQFNISKENHFNQKLHQANQHQQQATYYQNYQQQQQIQQQQQYQYQQNNQNYHQQSFYFQQIKPNSYIPQSHNQNTYEPSPQTEYYTQNIQANENGELHYNYQIIQNQQEPTPQNSQHLLQQQRNQKRLQQQQQAYKQQSDVSQENLAKSENITDQSEHIKQNSYQIVEIYEEMKETFQQKILCSDSAVIQKFNNSKKLIDNENRDNKSSCSGESNEFSENQKESSTSESKMNQTQDSQVKQNIYKSIMNAFKQFLGQKQKIQQLFQEDRQRLKIDNKLKQLARFLKTHSFNHQVLKYIALHETYSVIFSHFINNECEIWLKKSKIIKKDIAVNIIKYLQQCVIEKSNFDDFICYKTSKKSKKQKDYNFDEE